MDNIIKKVNRYILFAAIFAILIIFNNGKVLANSMPLQPIGFIDTPSTGLTVNGMINVRGWFLDVSGVSSMEVLVDGKSMGQAQYGISRPDVLNVYPAYQNANAGYEFALDTQKLTNGTHVISVRGTGKNGITTELPTKSVTVKNSLPIGYIETPTNGSTITGITNVRGWFLDVSGVSNVEVQVDGKSMGKAKYGIYRPDVLKVHPAYQNANAGFEYVLDTKMLTNGTHVISVRGTGNNGIITELSTKSVTVKNPQPMGYIETPTNGSTITGITNVGGWFLDASGVSNIEVLVDGKSMGQAKYGIYRPDVQKVYPTYQNVNAGFGYALDTKMLTNGTHVISVRGTGNNGIITELSTKSVTVKNPQPMGYIETPTNGSTITGITNVGGWFLDASGVSNIEVLVDGKSMGQAKYGIYRPDVQKVYPTYQNVNAGFGYALDTKMLTNGTHVISVRGTGNNGIITELSTKSVTVKNPQPMGYIETPVNGSTIMGITNVGGWFLDVSGVEKIEVLVDGKLIGNAQYGLSRPDVTKVFPEYFNSNSGFQYSLDTKQFTDGSHTLTIKETGKNGESHTLSATITIKNGNPYLTLNLMKPANITASDIVNFFNLKNQSNSPLKNYAQSFIDAQNRYGVNAQYLVAHAIWETGWGGSDLIGYKNNLYGYGAYDLCPFTCGYYFQSVADSIFRVAYQVRVDYLNESGTYFEGPNLIGMNVNYATDQNWKNGIASLMQSMRLYDHSYYSNSNELGMSTIAPPPLVRDIPAGQPYPEDTIINFPSGINAKIVNTTSLTFRSLPYVLRSTVIGTLTQGTPITVLGYNTDVYYNPTSTGNYAYRWYRVSVNGQTGWLYGGYLEIQNLAQVNISSGSLNIRSSTSADSSDNIIASVSKDTYLNLTTKNGIPVTQNGWYQVYVPNSSTTGWVHGDYIKQVTN